MNVKSVLKPEGSLIMGGAVVGLVIATYQGDLGSVATCHATDTSDRNLTASKKKAGWTALALVAGVALLARDGNIVILGGAAIIAMEASYTHAIHANPVTGALQTPPAAAYAPAQNVVPIQSQGPAVAGYGG
jgi:hypothetical protein